MNPYRSKEWKNFRDEVIKLDGSKCTSCNRTSADGVVLQVHHKNYRAGRLPWEYGHDECLALCKGCHAAEHGIIPPRFGWDFIGYDDLGELTGTCENCGTDIRHVYLISHPKWGVYEVGEICCDNLTCTEVASNHAESLRRYRDRRKTFVSSSRWRRLEQNVERIKHKGIVVDIVRKSEIFITAFGHVGKLRFESVIDAKMRLFDLFESGAMSEFAERMRRRNRILARLP